MSRRTQYHVEDYQGAWDLSRYRHKSFRFIEDAIALADKWQSESEQPDNAVYVRLGRYCDVYNARWKTRYDTRWSSL